MHIQSFIFCWRAQFEKVRSTEDQLLSLGIKPTVVNSDEDHEMNDWLNVGEDAYFTKQFTTVLEQFDADVFFHIQGDATCNDWEAVLKDAKQTFEDYRWGIYAPNVDYTYHDSSKVDLLSLDCKDPQLRIVSCTDCTCWFIHKDVINTLKRSNISFDHNKYGWGIDMLIAAISFSIKRPVMRDYRHTIDHPRGTGYPFAEALTEMQQLFAGVNPSIQQLIYYVRNDREKLAHFLIQ